MRKRAPSAPSPGPLPWGCWLSGSNVEAGGDAPASPSQNHSRFDLDPRPARQPFGPRSAGKQVDNAWYRRRGRMTNMDRKNRRLAREGRTISVMIEMYADRVEVSNPGRPPISVERFIDEYRSCNERVADLMRRLGICEEKGSGVDKVVKAAEVFQLPDVARVGQRG